MNKDEYGFRSGELKIIIDVISRFPEVKEAAMFGSRALGNFKNGSDVDISIKGDVEQICSQIKSILNEETLLPYKFDVLNYNNISNPNLKKHIDDLGKVIYKGAAI